MAYRWFLGLGLTDKIPDASTFSQNRRRRFNEHPELYPSIFGGQGPRPRCAGSRCSHARMVLYTDSTHVKANANKKKFVKTEVRKSTASYLNDLDSAVTRDRQAHGKKPLAKKDPEPKTKTIKRSTTGG